jgi:hypothetical protein
MERGLIVVGVEDRVMDNNLLERVAYRARAFEKHSLKP